MATVKLIAGVSSAWDERKPVDLPTQVLAWNEGQPLDPHLSIGWSTPDGVGQHIRARWTLPWMDTIFADRTFSLPFGSMTPLEPTRVAPAWAGIMTAFDCRTKAHWGPYANQVSVSLASTWSAPDAVDFNKSLRWRLYQRIAQQATEVPWSAPGAVAMNAEIPWGKGIKPYAPRGTTIIDVNLPPPEPGTALRQVPTLLVYYQMNVATVSRLPERTPLNFKSLTISLDVDSFGARWSGSVDENGFDLIRPSGLTRHQIEVTLNGQVWHLIVEQPGRSLKFAGNEFTVSGRGLVAELAEPHTARRSLVSTADRNLHQLAEDELVNTGWSVNWSTEFWLVPAGAWSYDALTPIQAVARLAQAPGAVIVPDESLRTLDVLPRYPVNPWSWATATPDWLIPGAASYRLSSDWSEKPLYNAVVVTGESQGVLCNVTRQGSAGDISAPVVVDPLITHQDGGRERGRNVIADHGVQSIETIQLPLRAAPDEPGLIRPLELIQYTDAGGSWRGLCVGSQVNVEWGRGALTIKQTIKVERHYDD